VEKRGDGEPILADLPTSHANSLASRRIEIVKWEPPIHGKAPLFDIDGAWPGQSSGPKTGGGWRPDQSWRSSDMQISHILLSSQHRMVNFHALNCRLFPKSSFCHVSAMRISHEFLRCTIDFCSAAFYLAAV
jgi:hypothetical protein